MIQVFGWRAGVSEHHQCPRPLFQQPLSSPRWAAALKFNYAATYRE